MLEQAKGHPYFLASALAEHQRRHGLDDRQLAERVGCDPVLLPRLGLCRRPTAADADFSARVLRIAEYAPCDAGALLLLLRETNAIGALRERRWAAATHCS